MMVALVPFALACILEAWFVDDLERIMAQALPAICVAIFWRWPQERTENMLALAVVPLATLAGIVYSLGWMPLPANHGKGDAQRRQISRDRVAEGFSVKEARPESANEVSFRPRVVPRCPDRPPRRWCVHRMRVCPSLRRRGWQKLSGSSVCP